MSDERNPFLRRLQSTPDNAHGRKSETAQLKKMKARPTPNSGARRGAKSDGVIDDGARRWQIESKSTVHNTLSVDLGWLVKVQNEALNTGRDPLLTATFVTADGRPRPNGEWVMMPLSVWQELQDPS